MKNLFYAGCCFSGFSFFLLLGQVIKGFPGSRAGAVALAILGLLLILSLGLNNWLGLWYKTAGHLSKNQNWVGFAPAYIFGSFAILALCIGFIVGG